ncbi:uncharacterized protein EI90DRAFT_3058118 [Cantharellus anzutake]|uniref:uncharacterized protein n=1 Tax=Cantharellus anzutake TaxID=1750568 RepID=UPI001903AE59|nr:uncharacterized protein EI90DRAFT_3058118 [Cantharellus anzutake]KAF8331504.1 hypothetical protein EI90DRAFT_3058118 [Cantharellus anzutake]
MRDDLLPQAMTLVEAQFARIGLASLAVYYFFKFGFHYSTTLENAIDPGAQMTWTNIAFYFISRILAVGVLSFNKPSPRWIDRNTGKPMPLPQTLKGRTQYALDLTLAITGSSCFHDRHWDFAPPGIRTYRAPPSLSRWTFAVSALQRIVMLYATYDALDFLLKRAINFHHLQQLSPLNPSPVTTLLPYHLQLFCVIVLCAHAYVGMTMENLAFSIIFVGSGLSSMDSWPPFFNRPFSSRSLPSFWGEGWHFFHRHNFVSISKFFVDPFTTDPNIAQFLITVLSFLQSGFLHEIVMESLPLAKDPITYTLPLFSLERMRYWNLSAMKFFIVQPIGIIFDALVLRKRVPGLRRVFAFMWLLHTGRWWADMWVAKGMWDGDDPALVVRPAAVVLRRIFGNT